MRPLRPRLHDIRMGCVPELHARAKGVTRMNPRKYRTCPGCGERKPQKANFYWRGVARGYNELCSDCTGPVRNKRKAPAGYVHPPTPDVQTFWQPVQPWPTT